MSSSSTTTTRPRTTKPRGICKYYTTPRGCFAGSSCKFLHGTPEQLDPQNTLLTPHDESKRCRFYAQGFCHRGDLCWFKHVVNQSQVIPSTTLEEEDLKNDPCSICFEKPAIYGLLSGCSHIFCITCIRQWRDQKGRNEHGNIKKCPMCREPSRFIIPSSCFWKQGHPERHRVTKAYKESMSRVPCGYFQMSLQKDKSRPLCPFGKDCFYQHRHDDGTPHIFKNGTSVCMRQYFAAMQHRDSQFNEFIQFTPVSARGQSISDAVQLTTDTNTTDHSENSMGNSRWRGRSRGNSSFREQLHVLRQSMNNLGFAVSASSDSVARTLDMVRILVQRSVDVDPGTEPVAEDPVNLSSEEPSTDLNYHDIPRPQSVSSSSSEVHLSESEGESDDEISRLGRYIRGDTSSRLGELIEDVQAQHGEDEEAIMMQEIADRGPEELIEACSGVVTETDEPQIPTMDYEISTSSDDETDRGRVTNPPFLTDGRGRVVWSSGGEIVEPMDSEPHPTSERVGGDSSKP